MDIIVRKPPLLKTGCLITASIIITPCIFLQPAAARDVLENSTGTPKYIIA